jgi:hypothetical protein
MPHFTLLLPATPGPRPSAALYTGARREIPRLARPAWPLSPALCVCVCVGWCDVPVPVDVFLTFGSAAVCCSVASAFGWFGRCVRFRFRIARVIRCSPSRLHVLCAAPVSLHAPRTAHTHLTHHTDYTLTTHSPHTLYTPHTTSTTPTPLTTLHSILRICKFEMAYNSLYALGMHAVLIDQV